MRPRRSIPGCLAPSPTRSLARSLACLLPPSLAPSLGLPPPQRGSAETDGVVGCDRDEVAISSMTKVCGDFCCQIFKEQMYDLGWAVKGGGTSLVKNRHPL